MLAVIRVAYNSIGINDKCPRQPLCVPRCLALGVPAGGGTRPGLDRIRRDEAQQIALFNAVSSVKDRFLVRHTFNARRELVAEVPGMFGLAQPDSNSPQSGGFDFFPVQLQLSQPFATVNSTNMPQEGQ